MCGEGLGSLEASVARKGPVCGCAGQGCFSWVGVVSVWRGTATTAPAPACTVFGFTLASTDLGPAITRLRDVLADLIATA
ncbi:hypothetical protein QFZ56_007683 [Streptomyces achromogenes]|uniref:Uncharacterized protein n=1 Tax=Streptomyces achromogenes TaxID=67255 RepID=A0ABU0QDI7_STRAH|nr:hypothetical protein [Streptomyces achromogenes]